MKPWFARFLNYPLAVLGHILWGMVAGYVGGLDGLALLSGGYAYQFGSAWYKMRQWQRHWQTRGVSAPNFGLDRVGLDSMDYAVGYAIGYGLRRFFGVFP